MLRTWPEIFATGEYFSVETVQGKA